MTKDVSPILSIGIAIVAALLAGLASGPASAAQPNFVIFIADDMTWTDSGIYGSPDVPTPNIDRLAGEGMRFTHAFQAVAMCAPTRQELYTGLYPTTSGAYPNHSFVKDGTKSLVHYFSALGYRVGLTGKTHIGPRSSFEFEEVGNLYNPPNAQIDSDQFPVVDFEAAEKFITRQSDQPFFLVVAAHYPHAPWTDGDRSLFPPSKLTVPPYLVDTPTTRALLQQYFAEVTMADKQLGELLGVLDKTGVAGNTFVLFTSEQGSSVPFAKWTLYDAGIHTEMIVRWPGKVAPGTTTDALVQYMDVVPTMLEAAGAVQPSLDGTSFLPVLAGTSAKVKDYVYGIHTNRGIIGGTDYPIRSVRSDRYKLIRNLEPDNLVRNGLTTPQGSAVLKSWQEKADAGDKAAAARISAYLKRPAVELYDLQDDPFELVNLADEPSLAQVRADLETHLEAWMSAHGDKGVATEEEAKAHLNPALIPIIEKLEQQMGYKRN